MKEEYIAHLRARMKKEHEESKYYGSPFSREDHFKEELAEELDDIYYTLIQEDRP